jgi:hypothetical protein
VQYSIVMRIVARVQVALRAIDSKVVEAVEGVEVIEASSP